MNDLILTPGGGILIFTLVVGAVSTLILDLYAVLLKRVAGIPTTDWGAVGHWLRCLTRGQAVFTPNSDGRYSLNEHGLGWVFHYAVGCVYAALLPLVWGGGFIRAPSLLPIILVAFVLTTMAGLLVMVPGMGGGFLGLKTADPMKLYRLMLLAHGVFTVGQYAAASILARFF